LPRPERSTMTNRILVTSACCLLLAGVAAAKTQAVYKKDGGKIVGVVTKTDRGYNVKTRFGVIFVAKEDVGRIEDAPTPTEEYEKRLGKIAPNNAEQQYKLGEWAFGVGLFREARRSLRAALKVKPDHARAKLLLRQVEAKLMTVGPRTRPVGTGVVRHAIKPEDLVSLEDIYRIRMVEYRPQSDRKVRRVRFRNNAVDRYVKAMLGEEGFTKEKFLTLSPVAKLQHVLRYRPHEEGIKKDILIEADPQFMLDFRKHVWPLLARSCATSDCHGSAKGKGGMKLFTVGLRDDRIPYTNFAILAGFRSKSGRRLIDRGHHDKSLLLQFGLPKKEAGTGESHRKKIPILFPGKNNKNYKNVLKWIEELHKPDYPNYRLKYRPPFGMKLYLDGRGKSALPPRKSGLPPREPSREPRREPRREPSRRPRRRPPDDRGE